MVSRSIWWVIQGAVSGLVLLQVKVTDSRLSNMRFWKLVDSS